MTPKRASKLKKDKVKHLPNGSSETTFRLEVPRPVTQHEQDALSPLDIFSTPSEDIAQHPSNRSPHVTFSDTNQYRDPISPQFQLANSESPPSPSPLQSGAAHHTHKPSPGAESFEEPSFSDCSESNSETSTKSPNLLPLPPRNYSIPQSGCHSPTQAQRCPEKKKANDVRTYFTMKGKSSSCLFCEEKHIINSNFSLTEYSTKTSTSVLCNHLGECHRDAWIASCDKLGIKITAKGAQSFVESYRRERGEFFAPSQDPESLRQEYSQEAFLDALVDFVASEDVSINIIESPKLRTIFLMLREDLKDSDIPH